MGERPYTPESLADRWACTSKHIRDLCHKGTLSFFKLGKLYRIPAAVVDEFERGTVCESGEEPMGGGTGLRPMDGKASRRATGTKPYEKPPTSSHGLKVIR